METTHKPKTNYYLKMPSAILDSEINLADLVKFGYPESLSDIPSAVKGYYNITDKITLGMLLMNQRFTTDGEVAFNIQIRPYHNFVLFSSCAEDYINETDFEVAKLMYGVAGFMGESEFLALDFIEND